MQAHATQPSSNLVFDPAQIRRARMRSHSKLSEHGFLIDWVSDQIIDRLSLVKRDFETALHIGNRATNDFSDGLKRATNAKTLFTMDRTHAPIIAEEEMFPFPQNSLDLITSAMNFHTINDLPGALIQMRQALKPDGLLLSGMLGGETLHELRAALQEAEMTLTGGLSPRVAPFADKQDVGGLMQRAGFALPVVDSDILTVTYDNMFKLMHDLRYMGEGNSIAARHKSIPPRALFFEAAKIYNDKFSDADGRIRASFEVIFMIGWAPHASQPKPLKPGSAKNSLADALGSSEIKTGEKATP